MLVEQALFTSAQTQNARGYHLVARSPGVPDQLARTLAVWGPTHDSLLGKEVDFQSLNYLPAADEWAAVSRTVYGQSEYSSRGGFRVETNLILLRREQLRGYGFNPLAFARTVLALGHLRLRKNAAVDLDRVELPQSSLACLYGDQESNTEPSPLVSAILERLRHERVAVIGDVDAESIVSSVLARLPERSRASLSYTTGLKPTLHRRFDLQFHPAADKHARRELEAAGIACLDASDPS
ncbi:MAG: hypothetical protein KF861_14695 [Planctomycetaceae bacterium]|nr:hypothetical protein [Planctomycetaceae bacterium]